ncbi:MAG: PBP1A family penicillin-binding protein [Candidatus Moraniibacteriota bacterium]
MGHFAINREKLLKIARRLLREAMFVFVLLCMAAGLAFVGLFYMGTPDVSTLTKLSLAQTSYIYDRTGEHVLYALHGEENRKVIANDQIPNVVRQATIASEDANFYSHSGVDFGGMARAFVENIHAGKIEQGGSTITQQLARNAFFSRERTIRRKILETVTAFKIESSFSKQEILDMYLNRVPYGANTYGIEMAAETYFGKPASDLSLDEAALLASLTKAPSLYSPYVAKRTDMIAQRDNVISRMSQLGLITDAQMKTALAADTASKIMPASSLIQAPHFVFYIIDQLKSEYGQDALEQGGWKIYTTLDWNLEQEAERAVADGAAKNVKYDASNAALTAIDPKNGEILAMVGSKDFFDSSIDGEVNVATSLRQPGSSFKPIAYATAFAKGFQPETLLTDKPIDFGPDGTGKDYIPQNYDGQFRGTLSMREALAQSLNIPAVQTLYLAGIGPTIDMAHRLGITSLNEPSRYGLALVLGGGEVNLLDMTSAFGVFAREGVRSQTHGILRIENQAGKRIDTQDTSKTTVVLDPEVARKINSVLSDNVARSAVFGSRSPLILPDRPVAAKTGTTQDFHDAWTVGFTPSIAVGVWVGNNDNAPMKGGSDGVYAAAPLWHDFMVAATRNTPVEKFTGYTKAVSGKLLVTGTRDNGSVKYYDIASGKKLSEKKALKKDPSQIRVSSESDHSILYYVNKNDPLGPTPPDFSDPMLARWEAAPPDTQNPKN